MNPPIPFTLPNNYWGELHHICKHKHKHKHPMSLLSDQLGAEGAEVGRGGVATRTTDIRAKGAQSCVTIEPERSHVMVGLSAPPLRGPESWHAQYCPLNIGK